ncbi:ATP-binding cassette domain-containing protein [Brevundimonas sp.]|uniref:amino acid ABC transporter ATP-binding/permease protein n=1 Tax=Brevundimonas sp. TaxID=1871086 RepID=UPI001D56B8F3|nr:ATP-binding cassette domain-containing protein [Brevundimonas sp.]MBL0946821.1 ATP-binding cassette domain-containing protein [Brevundimonas sp.]
MSRDVSPLEQLIQAEVRAQRPRLLIATVAAIGVTCGAALLLGLSGWFITAAALAGLAGPAVAHAFNYMIPSALIRLLAIVRTGSRYVERVAGHEAALQGLGRLRPRLYARLAEGRGASRSLSTGEASSRLIEDVDAIQTRFIRLPAPWALGAGLLVSVIMAALAHVGSGIVLVAGAAALVVGSRWIAGRWVRPAAEARQAAQGQLKARLAELEAATPELKAWSLQDWAVAEVARAADATDAAAVTLTRRAGYLMSWAGAVTGLTLAGVVALPLILSPVPTAVPLIALAVLAAAAGMEAALGLITALRDAGAARAATARLEPLMGEAVTGPIQTPAGTALRLFPDRPEIPGGSRLRLSGPSGVGKTTLIERMMGLRPGPEGQMSVGGLDPARADVDVRGLFAYAAQEVSLLNGTVAENLRLADPKAPEARLWEVLEEAALAERVASSPEGLGMPVGPGGAFLSGGERRRLTLARAYLRPSPWLVLDEPTEGLDSDTEARVLRRLKGRLERTGQGLILISHRTAGVELCDSAVAVHGHPGRARLPLVAGEGRQPVGAQDAQLRD